MSEDHRGMNYFLIVLLSLAAVGLIYLGFSYKSQERGFRVSPEAPTADREYWKEMTKKAMIGYFVGGFGAALTAFAIALTLPIPAEIGCITLMAAFVFTLAILCRKLDFRPCEETEKLQKRWKSILLIASFGSLFITQLVFQYFNMIHK